MKVAVDAGALHKLLSALNGPEHLINELRVLRGSTLGSAPNPIDTLITDFNTAVEKASKSEAVGYTLDVDSLAQEIRRVDGTHSLGAGALAEAILPLIQKRVTDAPLFQKVGIASQKPGPKVISYAYFDVDKVPVGTELYLKA